MVNSGFGYIPTNFQKQNLVKHIEKNSTRLKSVQ